MSKPRQTLSDYMVLAISPVLIMVLVGSLCFFLVEVLYQGKMLGAVCWVMFWFIIGIVLVSRIAIENSAQHAAMYGFGLAVATWLYMMRTQPSYLLSLLLLAIVWFCAHKLVWDCTLIDEDEDSSGQGLLQKAAPTLNPNPNPNPNPERLRLGVGLRSENPVPKKPTRKKSAPHSPGRWVVYFSLAALPLFGVGQMLLPGDAVAARRGGFIFLTFYLAAALGLLVTTSFLGLRRYLRQRYLKMPASIAVAWLKFGVGVAIIVLIGAVFLPRPGANEAWAELSKQVNDQLLRASKYAAPANSPGKGEGKPGNEPGGKKGEAQNNKQNPKEEQGNKQSTGEAKPGQTQSPAQPEPAPSIPTGPVGAIYNFLRIAFLIIAGLVVGSWIIRNRNLLLEIGRSIINAITQFFRVFLAYAPSKKPAKSDAPVFTRAKLNSFAEYKNPFFATEDYAWPPEQIVIYSYEAFQVWAREQGMAARPDETAREYCARLSEQYVELNSQFSELARLYAHAAYATKLPPNSDLEPIKEIWRRLPTTAVQSVTLART